LAVGVARAAVALEEVERVAVVGHLLRTAGPAGRRDQRSVRAAADRRLPGRLERRPVDGAGAAALAHRSGVPGEEVDRAALRVDEDVAEALVGNPDRRGRSAGGLRRAGRRLAPAAAAGNRE